MEKQITRRIKTYKYTFIKVETEGGKVEITDKATVVFEKKLSKRGVEKYISDNAKLEGYVLSSVNESEAVYAMSLSNFLKYAVPVKDI